MAKSNKNLTMNDARISKVNKSGIIVPGNKADNIILPPKSMQNKRQKEAEFLNNKAEEIKKYNEEEIFKLDPRYSEELEFMSGFILVRLFKMYKETISGILTESMIPVPTPSGHGTEMIADPLPYENRAVIVNLDPKITEGQYGMNLKKGDVIQIHPSQVETVPRGGAALMKCMFSRWDDIANGYQGYGLITSRDIMCKVKKK